MAELADVLEEELRAIQEFLFDGESLISQPGFLVLTYAANDTINLELATGNRPIAELLAARKEKTND